MGEGQRAIVVQRPTRRRQRKYVLVCVAGEREIVYKRCKA